MRVILRTVRVFISTTFTNLTKRNFQLCVLAIVLSLTASSQTYTTKQSGNWSSSSTWLNGQVPGSTIGAGKIVNIYHTVTYNTNSDLKISGTLNIVGDTLKFATGFNKAIQVNSGSLLNINNGGLLQNTADHSSDISIDGGRVVLNNARVTISRGFLSVKNARRIITNSTVLIGQNYDLNGTSAAPSIDSINNSLIETNISANGNFRIHANTNFRVANAYIKVQSSNSFVNDATANVSVISGAQSNYGFDLLKVTGNLQNDGNWVARIDAACIGGNIQGTQMSAIDFTRAQDCSSTPAVGAAPELIFKNAVLKSGIANKQGAIYRFANVITGVDAEIKLKKFSRSDIVMQDIDLANLGWDKAFQPQFGLAGLVQPFQSWYIDFELKFYSAGTNTLKTMPKVDMTALDVDGDGNSINEYAVFQNPSNVIYSTLNFLVNQPAGALGQSFTCPADGIVSSLISCVTCGGDGKTGTWNLTDCTNCEGTGLRYSTCNHAFDGVNGNALTGPIENFVNIDTSATQVMATYQFTDINTINFRYGASSSVNSSNGSGIRLNSLWFRQFSLAPVSFAPLPVKLLDFTASYTKPNVSLEWSTTQEHNFSHFILEHSTDGVNFTQTAIVMGAGETDSKTNYGYTDKNLEKRGGVIYYRLKQVDNDGNFEYSAVRVIKLGEAVKTLAFTSFPNPAVNEVHVTLPDSWQGKVIRYEVRNTNGQLIKQLAHSNAGQIETIAMSDLAKGIYFIKLSCMNESALQKVIKN